MIHGRPANHEALTPVAGVMPFYPLGREIVDVLSGKLWILHPVNCGDDAAAKAVRQMGEDSIKY